MKQIRAELTKYDIADSWNANEMAYCWRMQPDRGLTTCRVHGRKKDKARISVLVTVNRDGSGREPLWIIGVAGNPRCFKNINRDMSETIAPTENPG